MTRRDLLILAILGLGVQGIVAWFQHSPGYMDAAYYHASGRQLASGLGLTEPFVWNYLAELGPLPVPAHAYWMPLAAWLAAAGMVLGGGLEYSLARLGFILVAAAIPPLTALLGYQLSGLRRAGWLAGGLALFPAFYLPYLPTTDTFAPVMLLAGLFTWILLAPSMPGWRSAFGLGLLAGGLHLARADGVLWLFVAGFAFLIQANSAKRRWLEAIRSLAVCFAGYLLVMAPWMARNWLTFQTLLSPGGLKALWLTEYNDLFIYPGTLLTFSRLWAQGMQQIVGDRAWAIGQNLQTLLAVQGQIFLLPLSLFGGALAWRRPAVRAGAAAWLLTFLAMSLVFPFPGARGGFFHSGAALQPLIWALAPLGLQGLIAWGGRKRGWHPGQAWRVFAIGLCLLAAALSAFVVRARVLGVDPMNPAWNAAEARYHRLEAALVAAGALPGGIVMVNDPPQFYLASQRPAVSIPYGDLSMVLAVAQQYQVRYLLLEIDQLPGSGDLYAAPSDRPGLRYLGSVDAVRLYQFLPEK